MNFVMRKYVLTCSLLLVALACVALEAQAQLTLPRPSPKATVTQTVGTTDIAIIYGRPSVKARTIYGDLVPYDQVWRTGANEATIISFSDAVKINDQPLAAGRYSLHTIPGKEEWTIIFNRTADQWGSYQYDVKQDALRVRVRPETAPKMEQLTFSFPVVNYDSAQVAMHWDTLRVPFTGRRRSRPERARRSTHSDCRSEARRLAHAVASRDVRLRPQHRDGGCAHVGQQINRRARGLQKPCAQGADNAKTRRQGASAPTRNTRHHARQSRETATGGYFGDGKVARGNQVTTGKQDS
jgi:hypothetical protein